MCLDMDCLANLSGSRLDAAKVIPNRDVQRPQWGWVF